MYRQDLDALKGIAIIAVVLFHIGFLKSGYLGVDAFFVINGFLVIPSVMKKITANDFSFWEFMEKRIIRLLPLIVITSVVSLALGYFLMLPDDYENLSQSVIASNMMSQNILSAITIKNYWAGVNEYKPLMHLWYVGILFEFYIVLPLLLLLAKKCAKMLKGDVETWMKVFLLGISFVSLILYLLPNTAIEDRFYYLPYRFFEIGFGGIIALIVSQINGVGILRRLHVQEVASFLLIIVICCSVYYILTGNVPDTHFVRGRAINADKAIPFSPEFALLATVFLTGIVTACNYGGGLLSKLRVLAWFGKMSYSIFIWHQVLLAFYRYSFSNEMSTEFVVPFLLVVILVSAASYQYIEKKITVAHKTFVVLCISSVIVMLPSAYLYLHAGVVRDVPELDIVKGQVHRGMFAEYCDRVYQYKELPKEENGKPNVLVEGVSFGRDFANAILESEYRDCINLVYVFNWSEEGWEDMIPKCDYIFAFSQKEDVPNVVWEKKKPECRVMGIGTKNYGECNGVIYRNRYSENYFSQFSKPSGGYLDFNEEMKSGWGNDYIDMLGMAMVDDEHVRVFTDDNRYISQDCEHLTQAGAQWYARIIDWSKIFGK